MHKVRNCDVEQIQFEVKKLERKNYNIIRNLQKQPFYKVKLVLAERLRLRCHVGIYWFLFTGGIFLGTADSQSDCVCFVFV